MNGTPIGKTNQRGEEKMFGIKQKDRRRHAYVIGKTGMGKTTLLENMAISDIRNDRGMAIVDPHGDFADNMLDYIPERRIDDVVYFNPDDKEFPFAFNVMDGVKEENRDLMASGLVGVFKKIWADSWGPRLEYLLRNTILSLLEYPDATLLGIMKMLINENYRNKVLKEISDPVIKSFWVDEFAEYHQQFQTEAINPIQNKVGQFTSAPLVRNIIGQKKSKIDIREIMDEGKILILNLAHGKIGEDNSSLLGSMIITKMQLAAMERADIPEEEREDFYLYVDEFQNFATESFAKILSEARKYRLNIVLAHQYLAQLSEEVRDAVFGNVGTIMSFRVGAEDAEFLEREFEPTFDANDLVNLPKYQIYLKLMVDGVATRPFSATTMPRFEKPEVSYKEEVIKRSREKYGTPREEVEEMIKEFTGLVVGEKGDRDEINEDDEMEYLTECWNCESPVKVPFEPDNERPIFCSECYNTARELQEEGKLESIHSYIIFAKEGQEALQEWESKGGPTEEFRKYAPEDIKEDSEDKNEKEKNKEDKSGDNNSSKNEAEEDVDKDKLNNLISDVASNDLEEDE